MSSFGNTTELMFGIGSLYLNTALAFTQGASAGFLKNDVKVGVGKQIEDFMAPTPGQGPTQFLQDSTTKSEVISLEAGLAQLNATILSYASGGDPITTAAGTPVVVANASMPLTSNLNGDGLFSVALLGPGPASAVTITTVTGTVSLATPADYYITPGTSTRPACITVNPSSSHITVITVTDVALMIAYTYTPPLSDTVSFGTNFGIIPVRVDFVATRKNGKTVTTTLWQARVKGNWSMDYKETGYMVNPVTFDCIPDFDGHPTCPLGRVVIQR